MGENISPELLEKKTKQRLAMRKEYLKQLTNPNQSETIFDPAVQRFLSMRATKFDFFRETPINALRGILFLALPLAASYYYIMSDRNEKEEQFRTGQVAYKDRLYKFQ